MSGVGTPTLPAPITPYTQAQLLAFLERFLPSHYLEPIKDPGPGYEMLQGYAKIFERVSLAISRGGAGLQFLNAMGGTRATVTVNFLRSNAGAGAVTVLAGTALKCSASGRAFVTLEDAVFGGADVGPIAVLARAVLMGWEYNVPGPKTTAAGEVIPGDIDTITRPLQSPVYADPTIYVEQDSDATGGASPMLDGLGHDRGMDRQLGENDDAYRIRIRNLADTVSPDALDRVLANILAPYGLTGRIVELWSPAFQTCWNAPNPGFTPTLEGETYDPTTFAYNDPRTDKLTNRWLSHNSANGAFAIGLPKLPPIRNHGMAYNDPAASVAALGGLRAVSVYNRPTTLPSDPVRGAYNGRDIARESVYAAIGDALRKTNAGGVTAYWTTEE